MTLDDRPWVFAVDVTVSPGYGHDRADVERFALGQMEGKARPDVADVLEAQGFLL